MGVLRRLAELPGHRRGKWVVLLLWLAVAVVASPAANKLTSVVKNDQSSYLPGDAESTKVLDQVSRFSSGRTFPAIVVAERPAGIAPGDTALLQAAAQRIEADVTVLHGAVQGPIRSQD